MRSWGLAEAYELSALEARQKIKDGTLTSERLMQSCLERINLRAIKRYQSILKITTKLSLRQKPNLGANIHWLRHHYAKMIRNQNSSENTGFQLQHATNADILILKY